MDNISTGRFRKGKRYSTITRNEYGFPKCRWCGGSVRPPNRTMCSPLCVHEIKLRTSANYLRKEVYKRDKGICSGCGIDTKEIAKIARNIKNKSHKKQFLKQYNINSTRKIWKYKNGGGLWDADHIIGVRNGGGQCSLDNIQTMCISCHKTKTYS